MIASDFSCGRSRGRNVRMSKNCVFCFVFFFSPTEKKKKYTDFSFMKSPPLKQKSSLKYDHLVKSLNKLSHTAYWNCRFKFFNSVGSVKIDFMWTYILIVKRIYFSQKLTFNYHIVITISLQKRKQSISRHQNLVSILRVLISKLFPVGKQSRLA